MSFRKRYQQFLNDLETVSAKHGELTDTDVRERLYEVLSYYFVWHKPVGKDFPKRYAMFTKAGDRAVAKTTRSFVVEAKKMAGEANIAPGPERHKILEDESIKTAGGNTYDWFLGSSDAPLPEAKPSPDDDYSYEDEQDEGVPIRKDKFFGPFEFEFDGRLAKVQYDYESREYACWVRGIQGNAFVTGASEEEILRNAKESLQAFIEVSKKMGRA